MNPPRDTRGGVVLAAAFTLVLAGCCACARQRDADRPYRTGTIERHEGGALRKAKLMEAADVAGYPCKRGGWIRFHADGAIAGVQLARDFEIAGRAIPRATYVWFDEQGALESAWLARDMTYDGVPCNGGPGKISTGFYPDGTLRHVFLSEDATLQGVPCRASLLEGVAFHPNGRLERASVAEDFLCAGVAFVRGDSIALDEEGGLARSD